MTLNCIHSGWKPLPLQSTGFPYCTPQGFLIWLDQKAAH